MPVCMAGQAVAVGVATHKAQHIYDLGRVHTRNSTQWNPMDTYLRLPKVWGTRVSFLNQAFGSTSISFEKSTVSHGHPGHPCQLGEPGAW